jgi:hypothetical protein
MPADLKDLELSAIYDLLSDYISKYTLVMRRGGVSDGFDECKEIILQLQNEIDSRKSKVDKQENKDLDDGIELVPVIV